MKGRRILWILAASLILAGSVMGGAEAEKGAPLGLPPPPMPEDNPQTPEKVALGKKLFDDKRFSSTGEIACATCHMAEKAFTDSPLKVSEGIQKLTGTRNAPTVVNSVYFETMFWDGRSPSLEDQALHPFTNPVEMGLESHEPILKTVRADPEYQSAFKEVFGKSVPFEEDFFSFLTKGARAARPVQASYTVTMKGEPTSANKEALVIPHATTLEMQCANVARQQAAKDRAEPDVRRSVAARQQIPKHQ